MSQPTKTHHRPQTEQERFWQGSFGAEYTERNQIAIEDRQPFFTRILQKTLGVTSICELGANRGHNLRALQALSPNFQLTGVELNPQAHQILSGLEGIQAVHSAIQDFNPNQQFDLVFTSGVLIHINPDDLPAVYRKMAQLSRRYVLINEYYNPTPVEISYRGHDCKLFKRDFGGEFWDANPDTIKLVDYGFSWRRVEPTWDDATWWLFERTV